MHTQKKKLIPVCFWLYHKHAIQIMQHDFFKKIKEKTYKMHFLLG